MYFEPLKYILNTLQLLIVYSSQVFSYVTSPFEAEFLFCVQYFSLIQWIGCSVTQEGPTRKLTLWLRIPVTFELNFQPYKKISKYDLRR